jgi:hypothetical protein
MYVDALLKFSDAQAVTASAGSDSTIDLGAVRDLGNGEPLYIVVSVHTTLGDAGSNTSTAVAIEGDSTESFTPDGTQTFSTTLSFPQAAAAGTTLIYALNPGNPALQFRYIRLLYSPAGASLTSGKFDAFLTNNIQRYVAYAKNYTIS